MPLTTAQKVLYTVRIETPNTSGWVDVYNFFGNKLKKLKFQDANGFVELDLPAGEYYIYIRGDRSVVYTKLVVNDNNTFCLSKSSLN